MSLACVSRLVSFITGKTSTVDYRFKDIGGAGTHTRQTHEPHEPTRASPVAPSAHINLASQRSQGRYSVVVRDLYRLDCTWLRNHFPKPYILYAPTGVTDESVFSRSECEPLWDTHMTGAAVCTGN